MLKANQKNKISPVKARERAASFTGLALSAHWTACRRELSSVRPAKNAGRELASIFEKIEHVQSCQKRWPAFFAGRELDSLRRYYVKRISLLDSAPR